MEIKNYVEIYNELLKVTKDKEVSLTILTQFALDERTKLVNELMRTNPLPPSEAQMNCLESLKKQGFIDDIPKDLTKAEASKLIGIGIDKSNEVILPPKNDFPDY